MRLCKGGAEEASASAEPCCVAFSMEHRAFHSHDISAERRSCC